MTEVNGISSCSSLAFVGGPDRQQGEEEERLGNGTRQSQAQDKPRNLHRERGGKGIKETISYQSEFPAN